MSFSDLVWAKRVALVEHVLPDVLAGLPGPSPTTLVVERVAKALGTAELDKVSGTLLKLAARHPLASHDGGTFKSFGRVCRRWVWKPGDSTGWTFAAATGKPAEPSPANAGGIDPDYLLDELAIMAGDRATVERMIALVKAARDAPGGFDNMFD